MIIEDIKIGRTYRIVGSKGCCSHNKEKKCNTCIPFVKGIRVINIKKKDCNHNGQIVNAVAITSEIDNCNFHPDDLEENEIDKWEGLI